MAVDNKRLFLELVEYQRNPEALPSDYIVGSLVVIAEGLARKANFSGYTFREDMIQEALLHCVKAMDKFDPEKSKNPFAYFTTIAWYAFLRVIQQEGKHAELKVALQAQAGV